MGDGTVYYDSTNNILTFNKAAIDVSIDDGTADQGECIRVSGLMEIGIGSTVTASAKNTPAIECFGAFEAIGEIRNKADN